MAAVFCYGWKVICKLWFPSECLSKSPHAVHTLQFKAAQLVRCDVVQDMMTSLLTSWCFYTKIHFCQGWTEPPPPPPKKKPHQNTNKQQQQPPPKKNKNKNKKKTARTFLDSDRGWKAYSHFYQNLLKKTTVSHACLYLKPIHSLCDMVWVVVCWLLSVPATCQCISGTDLLRQFYVLPHWDRSCRPNFPSHLVTVYWQRADQSQH